MVLVEGFLVKRMSFGGFLSMQKPPKSTLEGLGMLSPSWSDVQLGDVFLSF